MWFHSINHSEDVDLIYDYSERMLTAGTFLDPPNGLALRLFERYVPASIIDHPDIEAAGQLQTEA